jgi:hypothetical protein
MASASQFDEHMKRLGVENKALGNGIYEVKGV